MKSLAIQTKPWQSGNYKKVFFLPFFFFEIFFLKPALNLTAIILLDKKKKRITRYWKRKWQTTTATGLKTFRTIFANRWILEFYPCSMRSGNRNLLLRKKWDRGSPMTENSSSSSKCSSSSRKWKPSLSRNSKKEKKTTKNQNLTSSEKASSLM